MDHRSLTSPLRKTIMQARSLQRNGPEHNSRLGTRTMPPYYSGQSFHADVKGHMGLSEEPIFLLIQDFEIYSLPGGS